MPCVLKAREHTEPEGHLLEERAGRAGSGHKPMKDGLEGGNGPRETGGAWHYPSS